MCHAQLNLAGNDLRAEGAAAIGEALKLNGSLTSLDVKENHHLGEAGWCGIFDALRDNPQNKIAKWDLVNQGITPTIAKSLAAYVAVSGSLTSLNVRGNHIGEASQNQLRDIVKDRSGFELKL